MWVVRGAGLGHSQPEHAEQRNRAWSFGPERRPPNLFGRDGTSVLIGTWIQMMGVLTALIAGVVATQANYRKQAQGVRTRLPLRDP